MTPALVDVDDALLCRRSAAGDNDALGELCRRHAAPLTRMCASLGLPDADADDVVQEALLQVLQKRHFLASVTRVRSWLYRVALHLAASRRQKRHRQEALLSAHPGDVPTGHHSPAPGEGQKGNHGPALQAALATLSPRQQEVVALRFAGLSFAQVAATLQTSENACKVSLSHAVKRLKAILGDAP